MLVSSNDARLSRVCLLSLLQIRACMVSRACPHVHPVLCERSPPCRCEFEFEFECTYCIVHELLVYFLRMRAHLPCER